MMNKKAVSLMIGYVLLVTAAVVMGVIVYSWMKTYVPKETIECPDDVSIYIKSYTCANGQFSVSFSNNGKFSIAGYYIRVKNNTEQELASIDLSSKLVEGAEGKKFASSVLFLGTGENPLQPSDEVTHVFNLADVGGKIIFVEISPVRYQEIEGQKRFVNCGKSKIEEEISCS